MAEGVEALGLPLQGGVLVAHLKGLFCHDVSLAVVVLPVLAFEFFEMLCALLELGNLVFYGLPLGRDPQKLVLEPFFFFEILF